MGYKDRIEYFDLALFKKKLDEEHLARLVCNRLWIADARDLDRLKPRQKEMEKK